MEQSLSGLVGEKTNILRADGFLFQEGKVPKCKERT